MGKLQLIGRNLGRVFNSRSGCMCSIHLCCYEAKQHSLKLKTRPKQLLGSILLAFVLPSLGINLLIDKAKGIQNFIQTLWCHNYMRLKFRGLKFTESSISLPVIFRELWTNWRWSPSNFIQLKWTMLDKIMQPSYNTNKSCFCSCDVTSSFKKLGIITPKVNKVDYCLADVG